jgi:exosortase/archaeosortase family protein
MIKYFQKLFNESSYDKVYTLFILKLLAIYFIWEYLLRAIIYKMSFNDALNIHLASVAGKLLSLLGFNAIGQNNYVLFDGVVSVGIASACNGISFIGVIGGLTFSTPTSLKNKIIFFPMIAFCIYISNILRIALLAYTWKFNQLSFEFNHKFLYLYTIYAAIFIIWYIWFQKVSLSKEKI